MGDAAGTGWRDRAVTGTAAALFVMALAVMAAGVDLAPTSASAATTAPPVAQAGATGGCIVPTTDMLGWWRGENDLSGAVGPTLSGSVGFTPAVVGEGMVFGGMGGATTELLPVASDAVSVDAWIKPQPSGVNQAIFSRFTWPGGGEEDSYLLMMSAAGDLWWATDDPSTLMPVAAESRQPQLLDGQFHHIAATWSPAATVLYVDGVPVATTHSLARSVNPAPATLFSLGGAPGTAAPAAFVGVIDEPSVYRTALTPAQVAAIHDAGASGKCPPQDPTGTQVEVVPATGVQGDASGWAVSVSGSTMVVGSPGGSRNGLVGNGVVTVYIKDGTTWVQQAELMASDAISGSQFGQSVAVSGDTLVIGAPLDRPTPSTFQGGSAYVFVRTGTAWAQQAKLVSATPTLQGNFANAVAVNGDLAVVGAARNERAAYVFARTGTAWAQQAKLVSATPDPALQFGSSVAVKGATVAVGAVDLTPSGTPKSSVDVFVATGPAWALQGHLVPPAPELGDRFGLSVALEGDMLLVGAPFADTPVVDSGAAYVFTRGTSSSWSQTARLLPADPTSGGRFATGVALYLGTAVLGAPFDDGNGQDAGAVYVFSGASGPWTQLAKLGADTPQANDQFGYSVAANGITAAAGAPGRDPHGTDSGSVFTFSLF